MYTFHEDDIAPKELKGRAVKELLGAECGCRNISLGLGTYDPHSRTPGHTHTLAEEVIFVIEGYGEVIIGGQSEPIRPGTAIRVPPGMEHSIRNLGDQPIRLVFAFSPPVVSGSAPEIPYDD